MDDKLGLCLRILCCLGLATPSLFAAEPAVIGPVEGYAEVAQRLEKLIAHEVQDKGLPAFSIALVDEGRIVWAAGFGMADPENRIPATAQTVYRVGSISKLFTDIAIMQLVERGQLDLDANLQKYLPDFSPRNPFDKPLTLRQLMSHRSGLVRESPVGNYFDPSQPSLADTVRSLNETTLVYPPEAKTKYSNAGIAVAGYVLEKTQAKPFARILDDSVLQPLGLAQSGFEPTPEIERQLARAMMWTYDGRTFPAPTFTLGTAPAGNLYSTVTDLGKFLITLFQDGKTADGQLLRPETIKLMATPQLSAAGEPTEFGIGFHVSKLDGRLKIGHGGAVYGFSTQLAALPDDKLGVVAAASKDLSNDTVSRISNYALRLLLARKNEQPPPEIRTPVPIAPELARLQAGRYSDGQTTLELTEHNGRLRMRRGALRVGLKTLGEQLIVDDVLGFGPEITRQGADALIINEKTFNRLPNTRPDPIPDRWQGLIGEYGWDHNTLYLLEADGKLYALIEWFFYYPLTEISADEYAFPDDGLYHGERLIFSRDAEGRATQVVAASVLFSRRETGTTRGETFRIQPQKPIAELRAAALAAQPPEETGKRQPDLIELAKLDPAIKLDIRYATSNNFMGEVFYQQPRAFLQRPAAEAVLRAHRKLQPHGYGLLIHDAYRPWFVTKMFYDATPQAMRHFVANPANGSRHNRGAAVDLTLYDLASGAPVPMVSGYDEFSTRAAPDYPGGTSAARWHRELLRSALESEGFSVYEFEWWHFDDKAWREYPILNLRFEQLEPSP